MTNYAQHEFKSADLSGDFGRDYAMRSFGMSLETLELHMGRFTKGPRKGLLRGHISWFKTIRGGWIKTGHYDWDEQRAQGFVCPKNLKWGWGLFDGNGKLIKGYDSGSREMAQRETEFILAAVRGMSEPPHKKSVFRKRGILAGRPMDAFVRQEFTNQAIWDDAFDAYEEGGSLTVSGSLDAPEFIPAGSTLATETMLPPGSSLAFRDPAFQTQENFLGKVQRFYQHI